MYTDQESSECELVKRIRRSRNNASMYDVVMHAARVNKSLTHYPQQLGFLRAADSAIETLVCHFFRAEVQPQIADRGAKNVTIYTGVYLAHIPEGGHVVQL